MLKKYFKLIYIKLKNRNKNVKFDFTCNISYFSHFEGDNSIGSETNFDGSIGRKSYIAKRSNISAEIGRFCSIGSDVKTINGIHPATGFVSTHPCFYSLNTPIGKTYVKKQKFTEHKFVEKGYTVKIGNDVWIGDSVLLFPGITIGNGAIIAAGAVVTKDVEPYSVVGGVPAKLIRYRFDESEIEFLNSVEWWNNDEKWLTSNVDLFESVDKMKIIFGGKSI